MSDVIATLARAPKVVRSAQTDRVIAAQEPGGFVRKPLDWERIEVQPPGDRKWFAPGWLGPNQTVLMAGPAGVGKSLAIQQISSELALGRSGVLPAGDRVGSILGWFSEDDEDELARRQLRIARHLGTSVASFRNRLIIESLDGRDATLAERTGGLFSPTALMDELREQVRDYAADVVILDNMARMFGGDENSRHEVTRFCAWLRNAVGSAALVLLSHPAKAASSEFSGSTAWEAAARGRWYLGRKVPSDKVTGHDEDAAEDDVTRWLCRRKANYSALDYMRLDFRDGVFVADRPQVDAADGGLMQHLRAKRADAAILSGFRALQTMGKTASDTASSQNFLPKLLLDMELAPGCTKTELVQALHRAMVAGRFKRGHVGRYANRTPREGLIEVRGD